MKKSYINKPGVVTHQVCLYSSSTSTMKDQSRNFLANKSYSLCTFAQNVDFEMPSSKFSQHLSLASSPACAFTIPKHRLNE